MKKENNKTLKKENNTNLKKENDTIVDVTATLGAFAVAIAALIVVFAKEFTWVIIFTTITLCFFGYLILKSNKK